MQLEHTLDSAVSSFTQIRFTALNGMEAMRVITAAQPITEKREVAGE